MVGWRLVRRALRLLTVLALGATVYLAVTAVQVWRTSRESDPHPAQAAVVMGAAQYNGVPSPDFQARLATALGLWQRGLVPLVVVSGAKQPGDHYTEAEAGASWLEARGVPRSKVLQVGGDDSWQNLEDAVRALVPLGARDVLVVTDGFHEDRSMAVASTLGLVPSPVPATGSPITGIGSVPYFAKEAVGVALGRVIGYGHLDQLHSG